MSTATVPATECTTEAHPRVRADVKAAGLLLAVVIGGNLLWRASDAGILSTLVGR
jgi:hypothetical protein